MQYGYFDHDRKEYVITRPDTPTPWINFLGQGDYGAFISNTAGGMSFDGDPLYRRITRYRYNNLPIDRSGKYIYIRDMESGEYWSPTWQPVMRELDFYECRHGMGYTIIKSRYKDIEAQITYFVPLGKKHEIWQMKIKNLSDKKRDLKVFTYLEFSYNIALEDLICEWTRTKGVAWYEDGKIIFDPVQEGEQTSAFFGTDAKVEGFDCRLENFLGNPYRSETNPLAVENGFCTGSSANGDYSIGSLCCGAPLNAGEEKEITFALGAAESPEGAEKGCVAALEPQTIKKDFDELNRHWESYISAFNVKTNDEDLNNFLNVWHQYQCKTAFDWSRFISYYERGVDRGIGYRDSMQDILGVIHAAPARAKERIVELLSVQLNAGDAMSVFYPATKKASGGGRSDDHLWAVFSVCTYLKETGDYGFLDEVVPYYDEGEGTVLEHLERGVKFTLKNTGANGISLILGSDWNDSLSHIKRTGPAESTFVFFQLAQALSELSALYGHLGDNDKQKWANDEYEALRPCMEKIWDGEWYIRAFDGHGAVIGGHDSEYNQIFLNAQSWAVMSGLAPEERALSAMDAAKKYLLNDYGVELLYPAAPNFDVDKKWFFACPAGVRENGGVFSHSNSWAMIAECMLGRGENAFDYYLRLLPSRRNDKAQICKTEPYVYCSNLMGRDNDRYGEGANSWLTGTAAWVFVAASQYIFGVKPDYDGVWIKPCLPQDCGEIVLKRRVRGTLLTIKMKAAAEGKGLYLNQKALEGGKLPYAALEGLSEASLEVIY